MLCRQCCRVQLSQHAYLIRTTLSVLVLLSMQILPTVCVCRCRLLIALPACWDIVHFLRQRRRCICGNLIACKSQHLPLRSTLFSSYAVAQRLTTRWSWWDSSSGTCKCALCFCCFSLYSIRHAVANVVLILFLLKYLWAQIRWWLSIYQTCLCKAPIAMQISCGIFENYLITSK